MQYKQNHYIYTLYLGIVFILISLAQIINGDNLYWLFIVFGMYSYFCIANSIGVHRLFCHRSYETTPFWEAILLISGTLTCYGSSLLWCTVHTQHHNSYGTEKDPHQFGSWKQIFQNNYQLDEKNIAFSSKKVISRLLKKPMHRIMHKYYWAFPITFALLLFLFFGWNVLLYFYLAPVGLTILGGAWFNYVGHDEHGAVNTAYYALAASGEWRHKLHHDEPWRWDLREKWYHIDPGAYAIMLIRKK